MPIAFAQLIVGLVLTSIGADGFVRGAASLAYRLGVSTLLIGLTVVAFGTSAPELLVCVQAALDGSTGLAIGNAVGSNIFNTAAIIGLSAVVFPIVCNINLIRREVPIMVMVGGLLFAFVFFGANHTISSVEGVILLACFAAYIFCAYTLARRERVADLVAVHVDAREDVARHSGTWLRDISFLIAGVALLIFGSDLMVTGAVHLARIFGVSELIIGLTIVGAGTGLPELATSMAAAYRRQADIAIGNVVGSNIFNILLILGTTATIVPIPVEPAVIQRDLPVMLGLFVLSLPIMMSRRRIGRGEGIVLIAIYVAYIGFLIASA